MTPTRKKTSPGLASEEPDAWPRVTERIKAALPAMKGTNQKIALCILEDPQSVGFLSIQALARLVGVHGASIVRFVKNIGFTGYSDFKRAVQEGIKHQLHLFGEISMTELSSIDDKRQLEKLVHYELENIKKTLSNIKPSDATRIINQWEKADCIYVAGFGATKYIAQMFGYLLNYNFGKKVVHLVGSFADYVGQMNCLSSRDILIIASLPPYSKEGVQVAKFAREKHVNVSLFTDSPRSPVFPYSSEVIMCSNASLLYTSSYASLISSFKVLMDLRLLGQQNESMKRMKFLNEQELQYQERLNSLEK